MFAEVDMRRLVVVEPHELGDVLHTQRAMIRRLLQDVDTLRCSEEHGYYVCVTTLENVSEGKIRHGTGSVIFWVDFKCIVFRPFVKEIVEAVVVKVNNHGFFAGAQLLTLVLRKPTLVCSTAFDVFACTETGLLRCVLLPTFLSSYANMDLLHSF